jgi:glycine oxidase
MAHRIDTTALIIGGGVIGLSIARELHKKGVSQITIVEKGSCGKEASWAAAGMLGPQAEADESDAFLDLCCASRDKFPKLADELLDETGIDIELDRSGTLYLAFSDEDTKHLQKRFEWQSRAGLSVERLSADDARKAEPLISPDIRDALFFPDDWQVENRKLLTALWRYAEINGIRIIENCGVNNLIVENGSVTGAETDCVKFAADKTVLATGAWTSLIKLGAVEMPIKVEPVRGQIIAFRPEKRLFKHVIYSRDGYIVPRFDNRILAGSTTEHTSFDNSVTDDAANDLKKMAAEIAPCIAELDIADHWSGLRPFAGDPLPIIGGIAGIDDLFIATAHYRNGILLAPITANIVADEIIDNTDAANIRTFAPDRFKLAASG